MTTGEGTRTVSPDSEFRNLAQQVGCCPAAFWESLSPAVIVALLAAAPKALDAWETGADEGAGATRSNAAGDDIVAVIFGRRYNETSDDVRDWQILGGGPRGSARTLAEAMAACDAVLTEEGWVLA